VSVSVTQKQGFGQKKVMVAVWKYECWSGKWPLIFKPFEVLSYLLLYR